MDVACGMIHISGPEGQLDIVCGKPARRRIAGMDDGCCDACFDSMLRSFTREELERQYPLLSVLDVLRHRCGFTAKLCSQCKDAPEACSSCIRWRRIVKEAMTCDGEDEKHPCIGGFVRTAEGGEKECCVCGGSGERPIS